MSFSKLSRRGRTWEKDGWNKRQGREQQCWEADGTDCTICLYDVSRIVSWVYLLAAEALSGVLSSCQTRRKTCSLHGQTERYMPTQNSLIPLLTWTKQSKIRDGKEHCAKVNWIERQKKFSFPPKFVCVSLFVHLGELADKPVYMTVI